VIINPRVVGSCIVLDAQVQIFIIINEIGLKFVESLLRVFHICKKDTKINVE